MKYRTKVTVISNEKSYSPGSILPDNISDADMAFLKEKGFVEAADVAQAACEEPDDFSDLEYEEDADNFDGFHELEPETLKSPDEIRKIRSKKEVVIYAKEAGLDLGNDYEGKSLKELQEAVINFQEECQAGDGGFPIGE